MIILAVVAAIALAVGGGVFLAYLGRHPKCPRCGDRVDFVIPLLLRKCDPEYTCPHCHAVIPAAEFRPRQGGGRRDRDTRRRRLRK